MLQWEPDGIAQDDQRHDTQRLLEFLRGYLGLTRLPILLCGQHATLTLEPLRPLGVRGYVALGASQSIRETLQAMSAARANPTLWNMLWREAA